MTRETVDGPDFLCIGMPKAGTGWFYDQIKYHPDFWMPPIKELGYLTRLRLAIHKRAEMAKSHSGRFLKWSSTGEGDLRAVQFLQEAASAAHKPLDLDKYARLFRFKENLLCGDCTTGYSALAPEVIAKVGERLPNTKVVFLVRDPVERAWSHISMWCRKNIVSEETATNPALLASFLQENDRLSGLSFPSKIASTWKSNAPQLQFRTFFYDGIAYDPEPLRRDILLFLGADPDQELKVAAAFNRKAAKKKLPLSESAKAVLVDHFREELRLCATMFGGAATRWSRKYGLDEKRQTWVFLRSFLRLGANGRSGVEPPSAQESGRSGRRQGTGRTGTSRSRWRLRQLP